MIVSAYTLVNMFLSFFIIQAFHLLSCSLHSIILSTFYSLIHNINKFIFLPRFICIQLRQYNVQMHVTKRLHTITDNFVPPPTPPPTYTYKQCHHATKSSQEEYKATLNIHTCTCVENHRFLAMFSFSLLQLTNFRT